MFKEPTGERAPESFSELENEAIDLLSKPDNIKTIAEIDKFVEDHSDQIREYLLRRLFDKMESFGSKNGPVDTASQLDPDRAIRRMIEQRDHRISDLLEWG
ncbi:hypothetical protein HOG17_00610 [Candidatus Peregrinibacteria bacterium]|jgi:hypothetical protein|nr:hypothetical protein [Candidatus Peregrinibacteria bacterium]MBT4148647.1 hypothetical protein [Candidatus Peregrinibacteria bacterium]MBT4366347.1 hypothetical protein [Candidatus Peregrinibacteria bacterium]MBT4456022.1 hypothetical protein [Candidatus Peregrinibacteria bacterium]